MSAKYLNRNRRGQSVVTEKWANLFTGLIATTAAPTTAAQGIDIPKGAHGKTMVVRLRHTATGARTASVALYGYCPGEVNAAGDDIASTAGWDSMAVTYDLASVAANGNVSIMVLEAPSVYSRLYLRITAITGTSCTLGAAVAFTQD